MRESTADVLRRLFPRTIPVPPDSWFEDVGRVVDERNGVDRRAICVDCGEPARPLPVEPTICPRCCARRLARPGALEDLLREMEETEEET